MSTHHKRKAPFSSQKERPKKDEESKLIELEYHGNAILNLMFEHKI